MVCLIEIFIVFIEHADTNPTRMKDRLHPYNTTNEMKDVCQAHYLANHHFMHPFSFKIPYIEISSKALLIK